ncbi:MAG TPA: hypothetical protein VLA34_02670 [Candidatus Krumholzibacterium sp.]|nr:hypothetical protein [Candidatus Krumholzibacterium sp.]
MPDDRVYDFPKYDLDRYRHYPPPIRLEWVMDPPPFIIDKLSDEVMTEVFQAKMEGLARIAKLEAQMKEVEAEVFQKIAKTIRF